MNWDHCILTTYFLHQSTCGPPPHPRPDFVLRIRVTKAKVGYDKLVIEHINGIGGDGAKLIGGAVHDVLKQWRPGIERDLLAKANDAIVKAADTREIRLGFGGLLKAK
jgi:hypothetical protein